jgi:hypothetical protein
MTIGRIAVLLLIPALVLGTVGVVLADDDGRGDDDEPTQAIELRKDDAGADAELVDDDEGDDDNTNGDDGTDGGENTGDGDDTEGDDGDRTGDATAGNDGTSGGDNTDAPAAPVAAPAAAAPVEPQPVAPAPAPAPVYGDDSGYGTDG